MLHALLLAALSAAPGIGGQSRRAQPAIRFLTRGVSAAEECTGNAVADSWGRVPTYARSSSATCTKRDGTVVTLTTDKPRLQANGILMEGPATNLVTTSEDASAFSLLWHITVTADTAVAPDGSTTADTITDDATTNTHNVYPGYTTTTTGAAVSAYVKAGTKTWALLSPKDTPTGAGVYFNLSNCTKGSEKGLSHGDVVNLGNGWCRLLVWDAALAAGAQNYELGLANGDNAGNYAGDGTGTIYVWGMQAENTTTGPTSYIKTTGTAATRAYDKLFWGGRTLPGLAGCIGYDVAPAQRVTVDSYEFLDTRASGSAGPGVTSEGSGSLKMSFNTTDGSASAGTASATLAWAIGQKYRMAGSWDGATMRNYRDGVQLSTAATGKDPTGHAAVYLGTRSDTWSGATPQAELSNLIIKASPGGCQ